MARKLAPPATACAHEAGTLGWSSAGAALSALLLPLSRVLSRSASADAAVWRARTRRLASIVRIRPARLLLPALLITAIAAAAAAQDPADEENGCVLCHGNADVWEADTQHLFVSAADLAGDIHWQKGVKCQECHGGNSETFELREAHAIEDGFRPIDSPSDISGFCGHCHSDADYMRRFQPEGSTDPVARFLEGAHGRHLAETGGPQAATCLSCHPKHQMRSSADPNSSVHPRNLVETCGSCHVDQRTSLRKGVHHAAGERSETGAATPLDCGKCHGQDAHAMLPVTDTHSPAFLDNQVRVCGSCHEKYLATYEASVHGLGLRRSGLLVTAVCSDCHRAHDIYYAADNRSSLHASNVASTCGNCHLFLEQRLAQSVHGSAAATGDDASPSDSGKRRPNCVDCHQGHDQPDPASPEFHFQVPNRCGNCHADYASQYGMSLHGHLTRLGYQPAANCSDCHGAHDILPASNPQSRVAPERRLETCRQCHPHVTANFAGFDPHADYRDHRRYPALHSMYSGTETLIYVLVGLFVLHAFLWFLRSLIDALRFGRPRRLAAAEPAVISFPPIHRWMYGLTILAFMTLTLTGLPLKYSDQAWAGRLASALGGFETTRLWHHVGALLVVVVCVVHLVWVGRLLFARRREGLTWKAIVFGPDSPVPNTRDARDAAGMLGWFFGMCRKPGFERWTYWEKFDYWAVWLALAVIGGSGLLLWFPNVFCLVLPGSVLNFAQVMHAQTALMVAGCLFVIHFFNTHLRPEKFPLDLSVLTGVVSEAHLRRARPDYLERLRREGKLQQFRTAAPARSQLRWATAIGWLVLLAGGMLLLWSLLAYLGK